MPCKGKANLIAQYENKFINGELSVVQPNYASLMGCSWIRDLDLELKQIDAEMSLNLISSNPMSNFKVHILDNILNYFKEIF